MRTRVCFLCCSQKYIVVVRDKLRQGAAQQNNLSVGKQHTMATRKTDASMQKPVRMWLWRFCDFHGLCHVIVFFVCLILLYVANAWLNI